MRVSIVACLLVCTAASTAFAQAGTGGSVRGYVKDEQDAVLPGVRITATSADAPGDHVGIADEAGYYRLRDLPPATYQLTAELDGFSKWTRLVVVRAGLNISISIVMQVGSVAESVDVTSETPLLETQAAVRGVNISGDLARQLPLFARRHWTNFLAVTPGVLTTTLGGEANFYFVHGSNFDSQVALVDGADVNGASQSYTFNVNMSNETLEDVQVRTGGMDASAPLGTGVLINAVTKSGTNEPRGSAVLVLQPRRWNGSNADAGGTSQKASVVQSDFAMGGPLRRNRSWVFGAYRYNRVVDDIARTPQQVLALRALTPSFEAFDRGNRSNFVFAKSTTQATPDHRITGSYRYDVNPLDGGSATDAALFGRSMSGGHAIAAQLASVWRRRWLSTINASYNTTANPSELLRIDAPSRPVAQGVLLSAGRLRSTGLIGTLDNTATWSDQPNHKATVTADLSIPAGNALGQHEIQAGVYGQRLHVDNITHYANGGFATEELVLLNPNDAAAGAIPFHRQIFDADQATTRVIDASDFAFYLQDVWRPGTRITITAGVRADIVRQTDKLFNLRSQDSVDVGPRAGVNYAVTSAPASGIRVNWSRRHDVISLTTGGTSAIGFRDVYDLNLDGVFETTFVTPGATVRSPDRQYDSNRHQPYVDEFAAAYGIQLPGSTTLEVSAIDRRFKEAGALSEVNGIYDEGVFKGYRDISLNDVYLVTNNTWNHPVYRGIEVSASKRGSRLQAFGSYTRQWRHLEGTWQPNDPASFIQPDAFPNDKGLGRGQSDPTQANSLSGISMAQNVGPASQWQDHLFNAAVNVILRDQFKASASYVFSSGPWSGPVVTRVASGDPRFGPSTIVLANGRLASNPLATITRFVGTTRSDGQFTLEPLHILNVGAGWLVRFGRFRADATLRILNVLNGGTDQLLLSGGNQSFSPNYRLAGQRQAPRAAQLTLRVDF